jgi:predicted transcriptional regulator
MDEQNTLSLSELTADIVSAYVSNNNLRPEELASFVTEVHTALQKAPNGSAEPTQETQQPAVPIKRSITPDYIISLENGQKFKSLKRHLMNSYGMTPDDYRAKGGLPRDYPMVAPNYAKSRSELARSMGLGRKPASAAASPKPQADAPKRRGRPKAAA